MDRTVADADRDHWARRLVAEIPALGTAVGGASGLDRLIARCEDASVAWRDQQVHLEIIEVGRGLPTVVFHHGYGAYTRLYLPFLGLLADSGYNVVGIDRPGHGLSDGRRGDCTVAEAAAVTRNVLASVVRPRFGGPVVLMGSSAGGMLVSCLLPYLDHEVQAAVSHNVQDPRWGRMARPGRLLQTAADAVPGARFYHRLLPARMRRGISSHQVVQEWFSRGADPLACLDQTWRSVLSMTIS